MKGRTYRYLTEEPLYPFGYGLTYGDVQVLDAQPTQKPDKDHDMVLLVKVKIIQTETQKRLFRYISGMKVRPMHHCILFYVHL